MIEEIFYLFLGILTFFISGLDDITLLVIFFKYYSKIKVLAGTLLALCIVVIISFFVGVKIKESLILTVLIPSFLFIWGTLKIFGKGDFEIDFKKLNYPLVIAFVTYLINAGDDFAFYSAFFMNFSVYKSIYFIIGIFSGSLLSMALANYIGDKLKSIESWDVDKLVGIIMILLSVSIFSYNYFIL